MVVKRNYATFQTHNPMFKRFFSFQKKEHHNLLQVCETLLILFRAKNIILFDIIENQPSASQPRTQPQAPSQQQSTRGRPRPKTQEKPTPDISNAPSASHEQYGPSSAWVPKSQSNQHRMQQPFEAQPTTRVESRPQSQPVAWGPKKNVNQPNTQAVQQRADNPQSAKNQQKRRDLQRSGGEKTCTVDEDVENLAISDLSVSSPMNISSQSSSSLGSSAQSSGRPTPIPTSALIPVTQNKGFGTKGRKVSVDVNFLPLIIDRLLPTVYQYDVTIEPNLPKRMLPHIFERYRKNNFGDIFIAFDGQKIAVSPQVIPIHDSIEKQTKIIDDNGRERMYMVTMKEARDSEIDFKSLRK